MKPRKEIIKALFHESEFMKLMQPVVIEGDEQKHNGILHDNALNILLYFNALYKYIEVIISH